MPNREPESQHSLVAVRDSQPPLFQRNLEKGLASTPGNSKEVAGNSRSDGQYTFTCTDTCSREPLEDWGSPMAGRMVQPDLTEGRLKRVLDDGLPPLLTEPPAIVGWLFPRRGRAAPPPLTRHVSRARAVPRSKRIVTGLLVYRRSLSQDLRLINVLNPILGLNIFDSDRDRLVSQVQCACDGLGDLIGKSRLVRFRSTRMELHDDVRHCYLLRLGFGVASEWDAFRIPP